MIGRPENLRDRSSDPLPPGRKHFHGLADVALARFELWGIRLRRRALMREVREAGGIPDPRQRRELERLAKRKKRLSQAFDRLDEWRANCQRLWNEYARLDARTTRAETTESDPTERSNAPIVRPTGGATKENAKVRDHLGVDFSDQTRLLCAVAESRGRDSASSSDR